MLAMVTLDFQLLFAYQEPQSGALPSVDASFQCCARPGAACECWPSPLFRTSRTLRSDQSEDVLTAHVSEEAEASGAEARNATKGELYHLRRHFPQLLAVRLDVRPTAVRPAVPWQGDWRWCAFRFADGRFEWSEPQEWVRIEEEERPVPTPAGAQQAAVFYSEDPPDWLGAPGAEDWSWAMRRATEEVEAMAGMASGLPEEAEEFGRRQPLGKEAPKRPSLRERLQHWLTHAPYRSWRAACRAGRGRAGPHRTRKHGDRYDVPVISADFWYLRKRRGKLNPEPEESDEEDAGEEPPGKEGASLIHS